MQEVRAVATAGSPRPEWSPSRRSGRRSVADAEKRAIVITAAAEEDAAQAREQCEQLHDLLADEAEGMLAEATHERRRLSVVSAQQQMVAEEQKEIADRFEQERKVRMGDLLDHFVGWLADELETRYKMPKISNWIRSRADRLVDAFFEHEDQRMRPKVARPEVQSVKPKAPAASSHKRKVTTQRKTPISQNVPQTRRHTGHGGLGS